MPLENYREKVERLARERKGKPIYNASVDHASIIIERMFAHARENVSILSGKLNARAYGRDEVVEEATLFLSDPEHRLCILVEEDVDLGDGKNPFFEAFKNHNNVSVRRLPDHLHESYDFHFLVMDGDSYRFEGDKNKHSAVAAFGDVDAAKNLENIFESLWDSGRELSARHQESEYEVMPA